MFYKHSKLVQLVIQLSILYIPYIGDLTTNFTGASTTKGRAIILNNKGTYTFKFTGIVQPQWWSIIISSHYLLCIFL